MAVQIPDLILLDWDTDGVDGEAVLRGLRSNPEMRRVPIILLTNRGVSEGVRRDLATYGVHWILEKPIVPHEPAQTDRTHDPERRPHRHDGATSPQFQRSALLIGNAGRRRRALRGRPCGRRDA